MRARVGGTLVFDVRLVTRLAWLPADLLHSDAMMRLPAPTRQPGTMGRLRKHGRELALSDPAACREPRKRHQHGDLPLRDGHRRSVRGVHPRLTHCADLCVPRISSAAVTSRVALLAVRP